MTSELRREQLKHCPHRDALLGQIHPGPRSGGTAGQSGSWIWMRRSSRPTAGASRTSLPLRGRQASGSWRPRRPPAFARENRQVISCGGGVVKDPANLRALHANGIVLFIDRPLEDLLVGGGRPLSTSPEALKTMEAQRRPALSGGSGCCDPQQDHPCGCRDGGNGGAG